MRLFRYIEGNNQEGDKIDMTVPVIRLMNVDSDGAVTGDEVMSFYIPPEDTPPTPHNDSGVVVHTMEPMTVYVTSFGGFAGDQDWVDHAAALAAALPEGTEYHRDFYYAVGYDSPFKVFNR